jgi:hypothetical protein
MFESVAPLPPTKIPCAFTGAVMVPELVMVALAALE